MISKRRHHPLSMIIDMWGYIKSAFLPALFLFVLNHDSDAFIWKYGRYAFIIITILTVIFLMLKWLTYQYELTTNAFHLYSGYLNKEEQIIPYNKIQNINKKTTALHRLFHMTSLHFETAMSGDNATVVFNAISETQAAEIERLIERTTAEEEPVFSNEISVNAEEEANEEAERKVHFTPTTRDSIRAAFTSFSFLILIPILFSIYTKVEDLFDIEKQTEGIFAFFFSTWWMAAIMILLIFLLSMLIGMVRIYIKYGKYEISSDNNRIYINRGVLNETYFSMAKQNVQAIKIEQSLIKRILGIVEIKLVSVGDLSADNDELEISSLYPFLNKAHAYAILQDILPDYQITEKMRQLPRQALWLNLFKGAFFYLIPAAIVLYFKPTFWGMTQTWWIIVLLLLFIVINTGILLSYQQSGYVMNDAFIQMKKGAFGTSVFVSRRDKISEVSISRSILQKQLGTATLEIINRAHPVEHTTIDHVPYTAARSFYHWYRQRTAEVLLENNESNI